MNLTYSGQKTASALVNTGRTKLFSLMVFTNGVNDVTVGVYDGTSDADTLAFEYLVEGATKFDGITFDEHMLYLPIGLYLKITTAGTAKVYAQYTNAME
jgi:hypothetical protein